MNYSWGVLSVSVTATGRTITKVGIASLDDGGNPRSQSIDQQSIPMLEQQAMQAQSANIQGVSGCQLYQCRLPAVVAVGTRQVESLMTGIESGTALVRTRAVHVVHHLEVMGTVVTIDMYGTASDVDLTRMSLDRTGLRVVARRRRCLQHMERRAAP